MTLHVTPRALIGSVRADADALRMLQDINAAFVQHRDKNNARLNALETAVDTALESRAFGLIGGGNGRPSDPAYTEAFASYARSGRHEDDLRKANAEGHRAAVHAAMSVGTTSSGGYLAPTEWDRQLHSAQQVLSPMRRLANVVTTGVGAYATVWHDDTWGSGWVGETAARPATTSPTFSTVEFAAGEIYANVAITQRLLDDSELNLESWLATEVGDEFTKQEGVAFLSGNGSNKPFGLLTYVTGGAADGRHPGGNLTSVDTAGSGVIVGDDLIGFAYSLPSPYRQGASWLMNSTTAATLAKLKDGQGQYLWREGLAAGTPATLLGYPVEIDEGMPSIAAGNYAVAFGNFKMGYVINDRMGTRVLRDPYTNKPFVNFYATKRVGGGVEDPNAIRLLKIKA